MAYPRLHLLGLPAELRVCIWRCIYDDILADDDSQWYEQRNISWGGLAATSRIIYEEISDFWPRTMIPYHKSGLACVSHNRVTNLAGGLPASLFRDFRHLTIQLPIQHDQNPRQFFRQVAAGLLQLAPVLQDLRIFFIGEDQFGITTNFLGCGLREYGGESGLYTRDLPKEGSYYAERGILFQAVKKLYFLHNLVLSNVNYPLLHALIGFKPALETLHVVTDSRSVLYKHLGGPLITWQAPAALKTLHISANAVLGAFNVVRKVLPTLEDLTFLIPADRWQEKEWKWLPNSGVLIRNICLYAKRMRRFRFCIEEPLQEEKVGEFMGALKLYLPQSTLEILEIHATLYSEYFGRELIEALPKSLKRLYVSQELIQVGTLVGAVKDRYFGAEATRTYLDAGKLEFVGYEYWERERTELKLLRLNGALLDRERNAHLFGDPEKFGMHRFGGGKFPITRRTFRALTVEELGEDVVSAQEVPEEALEHYEDGTIEHITEAEMAFHAEQPANAEDRVPYLVIPDSVDVGKDDHWMTD
jgi:hypothetical protein